MPLKRWLLLAAKIGITLALVALVLVRVDLGEALERAKAAEAGPLALAALALLLSHPLAGWRWRMVLGHLGRHLSLWQAMRITFVANFCNILLPGMVGGDAVRAWMTRRQGLDLAGAVNGVLLDRVLTLFTLVLLVVLSQPLLTLPLPAAWIFPLLLALGLAGIGLVCLLDRLPPGWRGNRLVRGLGHLAGDTRRIFLRPGPLAACTGAGLVAQANLALVFWLLFQALGLPASLPACLVLVPPVILMMTLPISISGWGVREAAAVTAFGLVGLEPAGVLVASVLFGILNVLCALPGGILWLAGRKEPAPDPA